MQKPGMRFRSLLIGQVAEVAGEERETIRTREKLGVYGFEENYGIPRPKGWKRYTDLETIIVAVHAHLKRAVKDDEFADVGSKIAGVTLIEEWIEDEEGVPYFDPNTFQRDRFMFFWRNETGKWVACVEDAPDAAQKKNEDLLDASYADAPTFITVNFGQILRRVLVRMLDVQIKAEESKSGGAK